MTETILVLEEMGIPLYSARGVTQTFSPIQGAIDLRRSINGDLLDLSHEQFRKYGSRITCSDQRAPAIDGIWPGQRITVHCVQELSYPVSGSPQRPEVSGSSRTEGNFVFYRPLLDMMVIGFSIQTDEFGATVQWELDLEEF